MSDMPLNIGYLTDPVHKYSATVDGCVTVSALVAGVQGYRRIADDAYRVVLTMTAHDMKAFRKGLKLERKGRSAGEQWMDRYGVVILPEIIMQVSLVAMRFRVPWGCAFLRCRDIGFVAEHRGIARWVKRDHDCSENVRGVEPS